MKIYDHEYDYIDFETIKDNWSLYALEDGTIIKFKIALLKILPPLDQKTRGMAFNTANLMVVLSKKEAKGAPSLPGDELIVEKKDLPFRILTEEWNEYKLETGEILKIKPTIIEISRAKNYDPYGEPNYIISSQPLVKL
jgi:hypothetical protein